MRKRGKARLKRSALNEEAIGRPMVDERRSIWQSRSQQFFTFLPLRLISLLLLLSACSSLEKSEEERIRKKNAKGEYIQRFHDEYHYDVDDPKVRPREKYPWE